MPETAIMRIRKSACRECWRSMLPSPFIAEDKNGKCRFCDKEAPTARLGVVHMGLPKEIDSAKVG